uniref:Uncharacterized protein n=1 Tax=Salix viminalis TaxID=40686 RepID=A0A6N2LNG2_SALVM
MAISTILSREEKQNDDSSRHLQINHKQFIRLLLRRHAMTSSNHCPRLFREFSGVQKLCSRPCHFTSSPVLGAILKSCRHVALSSSPPSPSELSHRRFSSSHGTEPNSKPIS